MANEILINSALIQMICCCAILSIPDSFTGTCHCWLLEMQVRLYSQTTKVVGSCSPELLFVRQINLQVRNYL